MTRRKKLICLCMLLLALTPLLSGCMDALDINKKFIVTTVAVDKKDGEIWLYAEIANIQAGQSGSSGGSSGGGQKYILIKGHGKTIFESRLNLDRQLDQPIYLGGVRTLIMTKNYAAEDMVEYLYRLRADETYRKRVITVTIAGDLDELFTHDAQAEHFGGI